MLYALIKINSFIREQETVFVKMTPASALLAKNLVGATDGLSADNPKKYLSDRGRTIDSVRLTTKPPKNTRIKKFENLEEFVDYWGGILWSSEDQ